MGWFGPSRDEVWRELSQEIGAEFLEARFWKGRECKVRSRVGPWTVTLETGFSLEEDQGVTRLRALFLNPEGFRVSVHRRVFLSAVGKRLGTLQDIEVGDPEFDKGFIIQGDNASRVRAFLADPKIRQMMLAQPRSRLVVPPGRQGFGPTFPPGVDELQLQVVGKVRDRDRLREMFQLFAAVLERLSAIGVTPREAPVETV